MKKIVKTVAVSLVFFGISSPLFAETDQPVAAESNVGIEENSTHLLQHHSYLVTIKKVKKHKHHRHANVDPGQPVPEESMESVNVTGTKPDSNKQKLYITGPQSFPMDIDVPGQSFVSTGPYIGIPLLYSGGNLIINSPNINEDVTLLNMRKAIRERLVSLGRPIEEDHAHLLLSGIIEAQAWFQRPGVGSSSSDIDLTSAGIDGYLLGPSSWTSGLISLAYDNNTGASQGSLSSNTRSLNSRVYINKAFIVIGDFQKSPFYGTAGQMYLPFGTYSSNMISSPLTKTLGRVQDRALLVGFQQQGKRAVYGSMYAFRGATHVGSTSRINNGGVNAGYRYAYGPISGDFGAGMIANLADAIGMQNNGYNNPMWGGFGAPNGFGRERILRRVPALNLRGMFSIGDHIDLLAEYVGATKPFIDADMSFNSQGAKPWAANVEAAYTFPFYAKPSSIAVGYGRSREALALGLAAQRYTMVFNTSIWKDTLQSLELRRDLNYAENNTATGQGTAVTEVIMGPGRSDSMVTAQFDIYF